MKKRAAKKATKKRSAKRRPAKKSPAKKRAAKKRQPTKKRAVLDKLDLPEELSGDVARRMWSTTEPQLRDRLNLLDIDRSVLVLYCNTWQLLYEAEQTLAAEGRYLTMPTGYVARHPAAIDQKDAMGQIRRLAAELGMTPKAGRRVKIRSGDGDALQAFLQDRPD